MSMSENIVVQAHITYFVVVVVVIIITTFWNYVLPNMHHYKIQHLLNIPHINIIKCYTSRCSHHSEKIVFGY